MAGGYDTPDGLIVDGDWFSGGQAYTQSDAWFKHESARAVLTLKCDFATHVDNIEKILGTNRRRGQKLVRQLPLAHPLYPTLVATEIAGLKFMKPEGCPNGAPVARTVHIVIVFTGLPYNQLKDDEIGDDESKRFVTVYPSSRTQFLNEERGLTYSFTDQAPEPWYNPAAKKGYQLKVPPARVVQHVILRIKFFLVPANYLLDEFGLPRNILQRVGRVNDKAFLGLPANTCLLMDPELEPLTGYSGINNPNTRRLFNVVLTVDYFDPPHEGAIGGHNSAPLPGHPDGKYAEVRADPYVAAGKPFGGGGRLYVATNLEFCFKAV